MLNQFMEDAKGIALPLQVPADTPSGSVVTVGQLRVLTTTVRVTQAMLDDYNKPTPQGLQAGEASCVVLNCQVAIWVDLASDITLGAPIYKQGNGTFSKAAVSGQIPYGYALAPLAAAGKVPAALFGTVPVAAP